MKTNFRTIFAALFAMTLMVFAMPQKAQAYSVSDQTVYLRILDADGNVLPEKQWGDDFTSKNLSLTNNMAVYGTTCYWNISPEGKAYHYVATSGITSSNPVNLFYPSYFWTYDDTKYEFIGFSKSYKDTPDFGQNVFKTYVGGYSNTCVTIITAATGNFYYFFKKKAPEVTYTLNYNTKGGTPAIAAQTITNNTGSATFTISSTVPSKDGYNFLGWSATDGGAVAYNPGGSLTTSDENTTIYAVWERIPLPGNLTISCEGLQNGESAVIEVKNDDSQVLYRVSVSSDNPTVTIKGVKIGTYKVAPMHWSWTYETMDLQNVTIEEEQTASVSFTAVKKTSIEQKYDENKKVVK